MSVWIDDAPLRQSRSSFSKVVGFEVVTRTERIGDWPVRVYVW